jgi:hypothetical protein
MVIGEPDSCQIAGGGACSHRDEGSAASARRLAERAHASALEPNGRPIIEHVLRVAEAVPAFARRVAWLHDALEWARLDDEDLRSAGLDAEEITAVRLLTREKGGSDDRPFLAHVRVIASAPGRARAHRTGRQAHGHDRSIPPPPRSGGKVDPSV